MLPDFEEVFFYEGVRHTRGKCGDPMITGMKPRDEEAMSALRDTVTLAFEVEKLKAENEYLTRAYRSVAVERAECVGLLFDILNDRTFTEWHNKIKDVVLHLGCWGKDP
jgi:hypothetical protein